MGLSRAEFMKLGLANVAVLMALTPMASLSTRATALFVVYVPAICGFWGHVSGRLFKFAPWLVLVGSTVSFLLYVELVVIGGFDLGSLVEGFTRGIQRILSSSPPIIEPRWPFVPLTAMSWVAGALAGNAILRRQMWVVGVVTAIAFGCSYTLVIGGLRHTHGAFVIPAIATVLLVVALVFVRDLETTRRSTSESGVEMGQKGNFSRFIVYIVVATFVALASLLVVPGIDGDTVKPRLQPEVSTKNATSPMLIVRKLREQTKLGTGDSVVMNADADVTFVNLASMRGYTGRSWSSATRFKSTNGKVTVGRAEASSEKSQREVSFSSVDLSQTGGWVPYTGRPSLFRKADVMEPLLGGSENETNERLVAFLLSGASSEKIDVAFQTNEVVKVDKEVAGNANEKVTVVTGTPIDDVRSLALRMCQVVVGRYSADRGGDLGPFGNDFGCGLAPKRVTTISEVAEIMGLIGDNRSHFLVDTRQRSGSESFGLVLTLMGAPGASKFSNLRVGSPEQFATAGALVLQSVGIPAAVGTGFRTRQSSGQIVASDAWTWVEVPLSNGRIAIFDPTPVAQGKPKSEVDTVREENTTTTTSPVTSTTVALDPQNIIGNPLVAPEAKSTGISNFARWLIIFSSIFVVLVSVRTAMNSRRRRKRVSGQPRDQMVGAWHNVLEAVYAAGFRQQASRTATEVIEEIELLLGGLSPKLELAEVVIGANIAVYATSEPDDDSVTRFVRNARETEKSLRRSISPLRRLWAWAMPMPSRLLSPPRNVANRRNSRRLKFRVD